MPVAGAGRAGGPVLRLTHYVLGHTGALYAFLYSDDGKVTGRTERYEQGLLMLLFVLVLVSLPISWNIVKGGPHVDLIGYRVDIGRFVLSISASQMA